MIERVAPRLAGVYLRQVLLDHILRQPLTLADDGRDVVRTHFIPPWPSSRSVTQNAGDTELAVLGGRRLGQHLVTIQRRTRIVRSEHVHERQWMCRRRHVGGIE